MNPAESTPQVPVAIIGMGCLFPGAGDLSSYWANIRNRVDAITEVPPSHWRPEDYFDADPKSPDKTYAHRGGFLSPVDFPALEFGIAPANLDATDTTQLLGLYAARRALDDAGYGAGREFDRARVSVILGVTGALELVIPLGARLGHPLWRKALKDSGVDEATAQEVVERIGEGYVGWQENSFPGLLGNVAAGRIANRLDLHGTNCVIDAACASSHGAVHLSMLELASGRTDLAVSGGLDTFNDIFMYMCFSKTPAMSPTGDARPFDAGCDGTILGEGLGVVVLKRLADAKRDGDRIYAVIRGMGTSSDGKGGAVYAPVAAGQSRALRRAYEEAGISPETVELVEAHGTGTKVGDAIELSALASVYREAKDDATWCALGSVKSQIGHTKAAAGSAGIIKAALALHHKVLPPTAKVTRPLADALPGASPFYVNTEARPWMPREGHPRRAAVSAFGFGGSNFHCVMEEADPDHAEVAWDGGVQLLAFSAPTREALGSLLEIWPLGLEGDALRVQAARARASFKPDAPVRLAIAATPADLPRAFEAGRKLLAGPARKGLSVAPEGAYLGEGKPGKLAMLFPGQGAQYVGMARELACLFPEMARVLDLGDRTIGGPDRLSDAIYPQPAFDDDGRAAHDRALRATETAQPALGAISLGMLAILDRFGVKADAAAGHSYGELPALHAAGRISAEALFALSRKRGELMAEAGNADAGEGDSGAMLAVLGPLAEVEAVLARERLDVVVANKNGPKQAVLSGPASAIARAARLFEASKIATRPLAVAAAFHSRFVAAASLPFRLAIDAVKLAPALLPVFANSTAAEYPADPAEARALLADQLARPVEFVAQIRAMAGLGITTFVEVGPGAVLTGLVSAILETTDHAALALDASKGARGGLLDLSRTLAGLAALGHPLKLDRWDEPANALAAAPPRPAGLTVKVSGANATAKPSKRPPTPPKKQAPPVQAPIPAVPIQAPAARAVLTPPGPLPVHAPNVTPQAPPRGVAQPGPASTNGRGHFTSDDTMTHRDTPAAPAPPARQATSADPAVAGLLGQALRDAQANLVGLQRLNEQTAGLHRQFLEGQETAQRTLQTLLGQQQALALASLGLATGTPTHAPLRPAPTPAPQQAIARPAPAPAPIAPKFEAPRPAPVATRAPAPAHVEAPRPAPVAPRSAAVAPQPAAPAGMGRDAIERALLEVVAEKTGYPVDVLEPSMELDADLGIDSIKRVEILSAIQEKLPEAGVIGSEHVGSLRTLGQIIDHLVADLASSAPAETPAAPSATSASSSSILSVLMEVVAEKTGYPVDVLEPTMELDADLGIDSIKRVEILSALQERLPEAGAIGSEHVGSLRTLGQIVEHLASTLPATASPVSAPVQAPTPSGNHAATIRAALMAVVAEKTGYPADVLEPSMELDADLGIDSIKRVEILSALQERLPDAAAIGSEHVGSLRTLEQIVEFLVGSPTADETPAPVAAEAARPVEVAVSGPAIERFLPTVARIAAGERRSLRSGSDFGVMDDGSPLAASLVRRLEARGLRSRLVRPGSVGEVEGLILLAGESDDDTAAIKDAFRLMREAGPSLRQTGGVLASVCHLDGAFGFGPGGLESGRGGALAGLVKTAAREWPDVRVRAIDAAHDLGSDDEVAEAIVDELTLDGPVEVGLSSAGRSALDLIAAPLSVEAGASMPLEAGDVVVVSGGARGVTAEVALAFAVACRPTIVVIGRSAAPEAEPEWLAGLADEPAIKRAMLARAEGKADLRQVGEEVRAILANREVSANLDRIRRAGSEAAYYAADVRDSAAVASILDDVRSRFGPVRALIHGAGVLADRAIVDQTDDQFARVYDTKVQGLNALLDATRGDDLKVLVVFSSTTARLGRTGQVAYAAANESLNKLARVEQWRRPSCRVVSANWGPWDGGMVTPALKGVFSAEGVALIPLEAGSAYLVDELRSAAPRPVEVVILGPGSAPPTTPLRPEIEATPATSEAPAIEPAPATAAGMAAVFERPVSVQAIPILDAHVLDGRPVLPMALVMEWLVQGAMHRHPGLGLHGVDEFRLLKGVILRDDRPETVRVLAGKAIRKDGLSIVPTELRGRLADGREVLHARAEVVLGDRAPLPGPAGPLPAGKPTAWTARTLYRDVLFHGTELQGIQQIDACNEAGAVARSSTSPAPSEWLDKPLRTAWVTDPLALDCAFQLMILWSHELRGAASLPTVVGRYRQFRKAFPPDGVTLVARVTRSSAHGATADIDFLDGAGEPVARIEGYECVIDASLQNAFRKNRPARLDAR
ncbi:SDR family oxidoreductase [Isosphaeraceae bacterium EP7]